MFRGLCCFFFQAEDGIRYYKVTGVQTCALPISQPRSGARLADADPMSIDWTALGEEAVDLLRRYLMIRSEERRVGEKGRSRWVPDHLKKKKDNSGLTR